MTIWQKVAGAAITAARPGQLMAALQRLTALGEAPGGDAASDVRFTIAMIALCAKMARSDGAVTLDEVEAFKRVVSVPPDEEANVRRVFDLAKQDIAGFEAYARQIGAMLARERQLLRDVLEGLYVIAAADGILHEKEETFLGAVAAALKMPASEQAHIRSLFVHDAMEPWHVLGLTPAATDAELKARHRELVLANHPDRLVGRGVPAEFVAIAERKLATINAAFTAIARERGL